MKRNSLSLQIMPVPISGLQLDRCAWRFSAVLMLAAVCMADARSAVAPVAPSPPPVPPPSMIVPAIAPVILTPLQSQNGSLGKDVLFTINMLGSGTCTYQWRKEGVPIRGATNATLWLPKIRPSDAGLYDAVIANAAGSVTSNPAILTIVPPTVIAPSKAVVTIHVR